MNRILCSTGAIIGRPNGRDITLLNKRIKMLECDGYEFLMYDTWYEKAEEITLREFALYVAHQEMEVQKQANVYDPQDTRKYWNVHTDGVYISHAARNEAMSMAIHDEVFYQIAIELQLQLSEAEKKILYHK